MRWLDHLIPEECGLEPTTALPPEVDIEHEYLAAIRRDALLGDSRELGDTWLMPGETEEELDFEAPERQEIARRHGNRVRLCRTYSWAIPNRAALEVLGELAPLVEVGAGGGYWAKLLRERGVEIVAYDAHPPPAEGRENGWAMKLWSEVRKGTAVSLADHPDRSLFLCWPSPGVDEDCWAGELLAHYEIRRLAFVGEAAGGCTGSRAFHALLAERFELTARVAIPHYSGIRDQMWIYEGKASS